jgi:hypothetical protein
VKPLRLGHNFQTWISLWDFSTGDREERINSDEIQRAAITAFPGKYGCGGRFLAILASLFGQIMAWRGRSSAWGDAGGKANQFFTNDDRPSRPPNTPTANSYREAVTEKPSSDPEGISRLPL